MIGLQVFLTKTSLGRFATKSLELSGAMWSTGRTVSRLLTSKDKFWTWNTYINSKEIIHFRDKSGTINQSELQEALTTFGYNLSPQVQTKSHHPPPSYHSRKFQKGLMWMLDKKPLHESPKNVFKETDPQVFVLKAPLRCTGSYCASSTELVAKRFALTTSSSAALSCRSQIRFRKNNGIIPRTPQLIRFTCTRLDY